jgi:hypothetical membrane protein
VHYSPTKIEDLMTTIVQPLGVRASATSHSTVLAGVFLFLGGATVLMGIITAEALYPAAAAYNTHTSTVSDLAALRPENIVQQPSATIFNLTMILAGTAIACAGWLLHRAGDSRRMTIPVALLGLGMVGVGFVPGNHLAVHQLFAMTAFVAGGVGAILTAKLHTGALRLIHISLGIVALTALLVALFLLNWGPVAHLGEGGVERWVVYPVVLWVVTLGASLAATGGTAGLPTKRRTAA